MTFHITDLVVEESYSLNLPLTLYDVVSGICGVGCFWYLASHSLRKEQGVQYLAASSTA